MQRPPMSCGNGEVRAVLHEHRYNGTSGARLSFAPELPGFAARDGSVRRARGGALAHARSHPSRPPVQRAYPGCPLMLSATDSKGSTAVRCELSA